MCYPSQQVSQQTVQKKKDLHNLAVTVIAIALFCITITYFFKVLEDEVSETPTASIAETVSMETDYDNQTTSAINPEATLLKKLLHNYDQNAKPMPSDGGGIQVYMGYTLGRITSLVSVD